MDKFTLKFLISSGWGLLILIWGMILYGMLRNGVGFILGSGLIGSIPLAVTAFVIVTIVCFIVIRLCFTKIFNVWKKEPTNEA